MISRALIRALVSDPFPETTRSKRRGLLTVCIIGIAVTKGGLLPEKVPFLGLETLNLQEQRVLLLLLFALASYYLLAFSLYVGRDCLTVVAAYHGNVDEDLVFPQPTANQHQMKALQSRQEYWEAKTGLRRTAWALAIPRWGLEVVFPFLLGIYAVVILWP